MHAKSGEPKLILGSHNSLSHFLCWQKEKFNICHSDVGILLTGISFDVILRDVFLPLITGTTLRIVPKSIYEDVSQLFTYINKNEITYLHTVPAKLNSWLNANVTRIKFVEKLRNSKENNYNFGIEIIMKNQIMSYLEYLWSIHNVGEIKANINLLCCAHNIEKYRKQWITATHGIIRTYVC